MAYCFSLILICLAWQAQAQVLPGRVLVWWREAPTANKQASKYAGTWEALSPHSPVYLWHYDTAQYSLEGALALLQGDARVLAAQAEHQAQWRNLPDDPRYSQWQSRAMARIQAPQAWAYSTGGLAPTGDSLVIAYIDGGCDWQHEDLKHRIWYNRQEIPDNGLDDDGNGYVDDYRGWNVARFNDRHDSLSQHGTAVAGIMAAEGNNGLGITGINWDVRLMVLSMPENEAITESRVVAAYLYILEQRRRYNRGEGGALVVATNASLGIDFGRAENFPIWCALYDSLGAEGVLNVGAVTNYNVDIDRDGDMPGTCPSDYLLAVTNLMDNDQLNPRAGYGRQHVDLGVFGAVEATRPLNQYNAFGGTSGAAPQIAAAIALMYSLPQAGLAQAMRQEPAATALALHRILLESVDQHPDLLTKTQSGGRLNLGRAMQRWNDRFVQPEQSRILSLSPNPLWEGRGELRLALAQAGRYTLRLHDLNGRLVREGHQDLDQGQILYLPSPAEGCAQGLYILSLWHNGRIIDRLKLVVGS